MNYLGGPVLGIETSCDETSIAIVNGRNVLSNIVSSQTELHKTWGGIVPEAAARKHIESVIPCLSVALCQASLSLNEILGIGVTNRPGLVGALSIGVTAAKAISMSLDIPMIGIHHLEAHILSPQMAADIPYPHLCLLVSGGHTEQILVKRPGQYQRLGGTIDDAAGEAFDKCARTLGLGYPGGPAIQNAAKSGDPKRYSLPRGLKDHTFDFSFAGLKTATMQLVERESDKLDLNDAAACVEEAITSVLSDRAVYASREFNCSAITLAGGVAANSSLRKKLETECARRSFPFFAAPLELCTDNAAMIAHIAAWRLSLGEFDTFDMDVFGRSNLPQEKIT